jgi:hypothetical protein
VLAYRLGPSHVFNPKHPAQHWVLDLTNPAHEEVARKVVALAQGTGDLPNVWNLRLRGQRRQVGGWWWWCCCCCCCADHALRQHAEVVHGQTCPVALAHLPLVG